MRTLLGAGLALAVLGVMAYRHPSMAVDQITRFQSWRMGLEQHEIKLGKYRIHYVVSEDPVSGKPGKPLVLVHGLEGRAQDWLQLIPLLTASGYKIYALDLLGFGRSEHPDVDYSIALQEDILRQFIDSQNLQQPDVAGWSMGGWVSLKFAGEHPERVHRLVLMDSAGLKFDAVNVEALRPRNEAELAHMMEVLTPHPKPIPGFLARDIVRNLHSNDWVVGRALKSMFAGQDLMDGKMQTVTMPVLILWGKQDVLTPPTIGEQMHQAMPQSLYIAVDGYGHLAPIEGKEIFAKEVDRFLKADPPLAAGVREVKEGQ